MNAEAIRSRIVGTLSADANVRRQAELELKSVCIAFSFFSFPFFFLFFFSFSLFSFHVMLCYAMLCPTIPHKLSLPLSYSNCPFPFAVNAIKRSGKRNSWLLSLSFSFLSSSHLPPSLFPHLHLRSARNLTEKKKLTYTFSM